MADVEHASEKVPAGLVDKDGETSSQLFTGAFFDKDPAAAKARMIYLRVHLTGLLFASVTIFTVFSIFWGALWKLPARPLKGWVVVSHSVFVPSPPCYSQH
jgi:hypothetical protein